MTANDRARRFADFALKATGRGPLTPDEVKAETDRPCCRWCWEPVQLHAPCSCERAQEEARRIRAAS